MKFLIVIPSAGRTNDLDKCLASLHPNLGNTSSFSAIVIDNNADDYFSCKVKRICANYPEISYSRCVLPGLSAARHHVLQLSNVDVICYVDDDVVFSATWFQSILESFKDPSVSLAGGPTIPLFSSSVPSWFWDFFQSTPYRGWACPWLSLLDIGNDVDDIHPNWIWGLNFAIRRDVLLECGGFHVDLVPKQFMRWQGDGETGLTMKLAAKGYKAAYRQNSLLFHQCGPDRLNPEYFAKRAYYQGVCNSFTGLRKKLRNITDEESVAAASPTIINRAINKAKRSVKDVFKKNRSSEQICSPWAESSAEVRSLCQKAEREGYLFHQREVAQDPLLREWICRDNYFDVDLRNLYSEYQNSLFAKQMQSGS
jgi:glycosyltransferase involved in cell wall biosynthesis